MNNLTGSPLGAVATPERITRARRLFFEEGRLPNGLISDSVLRSWQRCTDGGYKVGEVMSFNPVQRNAVEVLKERSRDLIQAALPEFQRLGRVLGDGGYGLLLTDAEGFAVAVHGPINLCGDLLRRALRPGVNLSEDCIGTNAMAAAMAEGNAVGIFGREHFFSQNGEFQCAAAPIFGVNGELRGTIDITRDTPLPQFGVLSLMRDSAAAIETALFRAVPARLIVSLRWRSVELTPQAAAMLAFGADGDVVAANDAARRFLDLHSDIVGLHHDDIFQGRFPTLVDALDKTRSTEWRLRSGLSLYIGEIDDDEPRPGRFFTAGVPPQKQATMFPEFGDDEIARAFPKALRALEAGLPLLIQGESGTGKEIAAQALHGNSRSRSGPFVAINCGAIPRELIEGELFGYADGAFTGARRGGAKGRLEEAHGGTLFLDEIGDMPLDLQTRLLRVLETRVVMRVGEGVARKLDFQLISATHQPLDHLVQEQRFRSDLLFRLNGLQLWLPPLRERSRLDALIDVVLNEQGLAPEHLSPACRKVLETFAWPGNCRQLRAVLRLAQVMAEPGQTIGCEHLPPEVTATFADTTFGERGRELGSLKELNQELLAATLREVNGNVSAAAQRLGVNRSTIHRWQRKLR